MKNIKCEICGNIISYDETPAQETPSIQDMLTEILLNTQEQCTLVDTMLRTQINLKDEQINKLHSELQFYKDDHSSKFINQVMKAVIKVRKDMTKRTAAQDWAEMSAAELRREYAYVLDDLTDLLEQQNIDPYETSVGEPFNASKHQVHKIVPTEDETLDKTVARSVSEGYTKGDKVLLVERVDVYQYKQ